MDCNSKFAWPMDGKHNLLWLFENLANNAALRPTDMIPSCRFEYLDSRTLEACIRWEARLAGPVISISYGFYLYLLNSSIWAISQTTSIPLLSSPPIDPCPFASAYTESERTVWNPSIANLIVLERGQRLFSPRYFRSRKGMITLLPELVDSAAFFILTHEIGHFVCGHWHLLASHNGSDVRFEESYEVDSNYSGQVNDFWRANELDADTHAAVCTFGTMYFLCCRGMTQEHIATLSTAVYQRHVELTFLAIAAVLMQFDEDSEHPSGAVRLLNILMSLRALVKPKELPDGRVIRIFPEGVWTSELALRLLQGLEELGRLFGRSVPLSTDINVAFGISDPSADSKVDSDVLFASPIYSQWMHLKRITKRHENLLHIAWEKANKSIATGVLTL